MKIKFCGFTRDEDVRAAIELGVDAIGLNLARGPRKISVERAAELARLIPPFVTAVALFVDADDLDILEAMRVTRCTAVQLHGNEPPELAARLRTRFPVIKAFAVKDAAALSAVRGYPADAYLLDAAVPGVAGGSGVAWDHHLLAGVAFDRPVILAGGLSPTTVGSAVAATKPYGVDVASGIESAPAIKDPALMRAFVAACRR
ncbi:MAG: phosphoribosylanthranilate isomerase [Planctomycetes bacterium]|jgi:phosphoribosylanthranilate isomerase|nr:phosphoribosylanthranilate isomerase [Planctomycetota bacterium]